MASHFITAFVTYLESNNNSMNTSLQYHDELRRFERFIKEQGVTDITLTEAIHIDVYRSSLMKKNRSSTVKNRMSTLNSFFSFMVNRKYMSENPLASLSPVKVKDVDKKVRENLSIDEAMRLIDYTEKNSIPSLKLRNKVLVMAFLFFGLRVSELCDLKNQDVSFKKRTVYISGKGGKQREVPMFDELVPSFKEYIKNKKTKSDYFFTKKQSNEPLTRNAVLKLIQHHAKKSKIRKNIGCHSLRRTAATLLLEGGVDLRKIQIFLGHASINTTMLYLNPDLEKTKQEIREKNLLAKRMKKNKRNTL